MKEWSDWEWWDDMSGRVLEYATTDSDKLTRILIEIFKKLPQEDAEVLMHERRVLFICPRANVSQPFYTIAPVEEGKDYTEVMQWLVILESDVIDRPREEQIYIIVHELAHTLFEHDIKSDIGAEEGELQADRQVIEWGFEAELRAVPYNYLYGTGLEKFGSID